MEDEAETAKEGSRKELGERRAGAGRQRFVQAKEQKEDRLAGKDQVEERQVQVHERQVAFEKALGVKKEIFLTEESAAEEGIFGEIGNEEEIALEDQVGLRKEG